MSSLFSTSREPRGDTQAIAVGSGPQVPEVGLDHEELVAEADHVGRIDVPRAQQRRAGQLEVLAVPAVPDHVQRVHVVERHLQLDGDRVGAGPALHGSSHAPSCRLPAARASTTATMSRSWRRSEVFNGTRRRTAASASRLRGCSDAGPRRSTRLAEGEQGDGRHAAR